MKIRLRHPSKRISGKVRMNSSKSESNRALIIQALCQEPFLIRGLSNSDDTKVLASALDQIMNGGNNLTLDVGAAGTSMRFLTAFLAGKMGTHTLTGSERMLKRPIGILVKALNQLGADIQFLGETGYPPLMIHGKALKGGAIRLDGSVSSQFVSALLMIAPQLQNGLVIEFEGEVISRPYINMTLKMMEEFRVYGQWQGNTISVSPQRYHIKSDEGYAFQVDGDWSAASYYYSMVAFAEEASLQLEGLKHPSLQGDAIVAELFSFFGVHTDYTETGVLLSKSRVKDEHFGIDFSDCPDLAQTIAVAAAGCRVPALLNGLKTLRVKETDRIQALKNELEKLGIVVKVVGDAVMELSASDLPFSAITVSTYDDHRMAMAFAGLALLLPELVIEHPEVVSKSYPDFWNELTGLGFLIEELKD